MFHCWLNQNNSKIQLINLASLTFLDFEVIFIRLQKFGHAGMTCIIFINILSTVSLDIFIGTVKQIVKFISYLTAVKNSQKQRREKEKEKEGEGL